MSESSIPSSVRNCAVCGRFFRPYNNQGTYCSPACRRKARRQYEREWEAANRQRINDAKRRRYAEDPENHRAQYKRRRDANIERYRELNLAESRRNKDRQKRWVAANRDRLNEQQKRRYADNPDYYLERTRDWFARNPHYSRDYVRTKKRKQLQQEEVA